MHSAGPNEPWTGKPEQLSEVVSHLKSTFGLRYIYCWHGLPGYWAGVMPDSPEMAGFGANIMWVGLELGLLLVAGGNLYVSRAKGRGWRATTPVQILSPFSKSCSQPPPHFFHCILRCAKTSPICCQVRYIM